MSTLFPSNFDNFTNPTPSTPLAPIHAGLHADNNDAIEALEAKVGANGSGVTTSHDYKLGEITVADKAVGKTAAQVLANKTLTSPVLNVGSDATGDIYYRNSSATLSRLPVGTSGQVVAAGATGIPEYVTLSSNQDASTTAKGAVEEATQAEADSGIAAGATGARLFINPTTSHPVGSILMFAGSIAPSKWLACDGTAVSRTTYANLFTALSTTYGAGDGSTTFNVPDMRGRVPVGTGTGTGGGNSGTGSPTGGSALTAVSRGTWKGAENHTLTVGEIPSHTHNVAFFNPNAGSPNGIASGNNGAGSPGSQASDNGTGGNGAHNNLQPVMGLQFIIRT